MYTVKVKCSAQTMAFAWLGFAQITYADEALTARNKALVRDFYTTLLIGRQVDAAPRFLSTDYIQHNPNVPTGLKGFMDTFRKRFEQKLPSDYKRELLNLLAKMIWLSSMYARHGRALTESTIRHLALTCFEFRTARLPSTGMLRIDLQRCLWNHICVSKACYHVKSSNPYVGCQV